MPIKHGYTATGTNDPAKQVSVTRWNDNHTLDQYLDFPVQTSAPAAPAADLRLFAESSAGRRLPAARGPTGPVLTVQPSFFERAVTLFLPGTGTTLAVNFGASYTARNSGTSAAQSHPTPAAGTNISGMQRTSFGTGTTATGASGIQTASVVCYRGDVAGRGGFYFSARFAIETFQTAMRAFVGLSANNATMAADSSSWNNTIGLCKDTADTNWFLLTRNATTATKTATGCTVTAGQVLDLALFAAPNGSNVTVRLVDAFTGTVYLDNIAITATLPVNTVMMYMQAHNQSQSGTTAKVLSLSRMYLETDT